MSKKRKALLIQASAGAVVLTFLMQPMFMLGFDGYAWMLFMALVLFFALGADFKKVPSIVICFAIGIGWAMINGILMGALSGLPSWVSGILLTIVIIFLILTVHDNLLRDTIFGCLPGLFLAFSETMFVFTLQPANAPAITPIHVFIFFIYGLVMTSALFLSGGLLCNIFVGKDWPRYVFGDKNEAIDKTQDM